MSYVTRIEALQAELTRLHTENEELRKALEPFAKACWVFNGPIMRDNKPAPDDSPLVAYWPLATVCGLLELKVGDCRRAAELLNRKEK